MTDEATPYGFDRNAQRREFERELKSVARLRNFVGGIGTITLFVAGVAGMFLRGYIRGYPDKHPDLLQTPGFVRAAVAFGIALAVSLVLGGIVWRLNLRVSRISAEITMIEMRG